jgi:hypothetical protein
MNARELYRRRIKHNSTYIIRRNKEMKRKKSEEIRGKRDEERRERQREKGVEDLDGWRDGGERRNRPQKNGEKKIGKINKDDV